MSFMIEQIDSDNKFSEIIYIDGKPSNYIIDNIGFIFDKVSNRYIQRNKILFDLMIIRPRFDIKNLFNFLPIWRDHPFKVTVYRNGYKYQRHVFNISTCQSVGDYVSFN